MNTLERFLPKFERLSDSECWMWSAHRDRGGYGQFSVGGRLRRAHRVAYELFVGPIPEGRQIDHTCHDPQTCAGGRSCPHRACVNPAHLQPVTNRENVLRGIGPTAVNAAKTHCNHGHSLEDAYIERDGGRNCRHCQRRRSRKYEQRKAAA